MGGYIIDGLYNAISDGIKRVTEIFGKVVDAVKKPFEGIGSWFHSKFSWAWERIKSAFASSSIVKFFGNVKDDIIKAFRSVPEDLADIFRNALSKVKEITGEIGDAVGDVVGKIPGGSAAKKILGKLNPLNYFAGGGTLSKNGETAIVGEAGPELLQLLGGKAVVTPLSAAPPLAMVGSAVSSGTGSGSPSSAQKVSTDPEMLELLRIIVELLRSGMNIEIINYMFKNSREFNREVIKAVAEDKARSGG